MIITSVARIAASKQYQILVGPDKKPFTIHSALLANLSKPLDVLVNGGMKEAGDGVAEWPEVDEETFLRFWRFAYRGDYAGAEPVFVSDATAAAIAEPEPKPGTEHWFVSEPVPEFDWRPRGVKKRVSGRTNVFGRKAPQEVINTFPVSNHWARFEELCYDAPPVEPAPAPAKTSPAKNMDHSGVFLSHARVYVMADYYDIDALMTLSLKKLHRALVGFPLVEERADDVAKLLGYAYPNTVDKSGGQDALRHLVAFYAACKIETLWTSPYFQQVLEQSGEISKAIIGQLLGRFIA